MWSCCEPVDEFAQPLCAACSRPIISGGKAIKFWCTACWRAYEGFIRAKAEWVVYLERAEDARRKRRRVRVRDGARPPASVEALIEAGLM